VLDPDFGRLRCRLLYQERFGSIKRHYRGLLLSPSQPATSSETGLIFVIRFPSPDISSTAVFGMSFNKAIRTLRRVAVVAVFARRRTGADDPSFAFLCLPDLQGGVGGDAESGAVTCGLDGFGRGAFPLRPRNVARRLSMLPLLSLLRTLNGQCGRRRRLVSLSCINLLL
jgi:hypothetical protein